MKTEDHTRENSYNQMMTRLFDAIKTEGDLCTLPPGCSLLAELDEVKERYQDQSYIAGGGMKKIYRVTDKMTDRHVAMAVMHTLKTPEVVEQFIHEARVNAHLEHPNIMPVYDIGLDELGEPFFTMKLVSGDNLGTILRRLSRGDSEYVAQYDLSRLLDIYTKVCDAVAYAHSRGVLHLDLKPENIQIGDYGEVLICDWGLSRYHEISLENLEVRDAAGSLVTNIGSVCGTPGFMAPEQVTGDRKDLDGQTDIYALGAILYAILSLKSPVDSKNVEEILSATVAGTFPSPSSRDPNRQVPAALEAVCQRAMALNPADRYKTAEDLKTDIFAYIQGYATSAENAGFLKMLLLLIKRHRTLSVIVVAAVVALASQTTFFVLELKNKTDLAERRERVAVETLKQLKEEQDKRRMLGQHVTPDLTEKVEKELDQFDPKAWESIRRALEINPEGSMLKRLRACMLIGNHQFSDALAYFENDPSASAVAYKDLLEAFMDAKSKGKPLSHDQIKALISLFHQDKLTFASVAFLKNARGSFSTLDERLAFTHELLALVNPDAEPITFLSTQTDGKIQIDLSGNAKLTDVSVLMLLPIQGLNLSDTAVDNITALGQLPLEDLDISGTPVTYLTSLGNCPLKTLDISRTSVNDLSPLRGLPLEELRMDNTAVADFRPLADIKRLKFLRTSYSETTILQLREAKISDRTRIVLK